MDTNVLVK